MSKERVTIAIEGIKNCGKAEQAELLKKRLGWTGSPVRPHAKILTQPDYRRSTGKVIRSCLAGRLSCSDAALGELFSMNRQEAYHSTRIPASVEVVIWDRCFLSQAAYSRFMQARIQGTAEQLSRRDRVAKIAVPERVYFLNVHPKTLENMRQQEEVQLLGEATPRDHAAYEIQEIAYMRYAALATTPPEHTTLVSVPCVDTETDTLRDANDISDFIFEDLTKWMRQRSRSE